MKQAAFLQAGDQVCPVISDDDWDNRTGSEPWLTVISRTDGDIVAVGLKLAGVWRPGENARHLVNRGSSRRRVCIKGICN